MTTIKYKWNEEIGNYCLWGNGKFITPLEPIKLSEVDKESLAESLQMIYFQRTGKIDYGIGLSHEIDVKKAKELGCWD